MQNLILIVAITLLTSIASLLRADPPTPMKALAKMPVREITVFKDGHAFVLHSGKMPTEANGNVVMDYLPTPVVGTFWPYASEKGATLAGVTASQHKVLIDRTAVSLRELIEANIGAVVSVTEAAPDASINGKAIIYDATILSVPEQSGEELEATSPPNSGEKLPVKGNIVLMKTAMGDKVVNIDRILDITFKADHKPLLPTQEFRNVLTLKLDWAGGKPAKEAEVGMMYLQKGVRWIPEYKIVIDGKETATITLAATILNEMADLDDVTAHLVVGVPSFAFKDTIDPISLQRTMARLSQYFQPDAQTGNNYSNSMMTQVVQSNPGAPGREDGQRQPDLGPELAGSGGNEDLFLFTVKHVSLKKGQRMVLPIAEYKVPYKDVYELTVPFAPPQELRGHLNEARAAEMARLLNAPKVMHKLRLTNKSAYPFTTAPALLIKNDRVLAQGMMTYTAIGADSDLEMTTAVDVQVTKTEKETKRTPNAATWQGNSYARTDLEGKLTLANYRHEAVTVKVTRFVLGAGDFADNGGKVEMVNQFEDFAASAGVHPSWWGWYSWPAWWSHFNGVGRMTWDVKLEPGKSVELNYTWHNFWQ
jgi:hypothetical protein